MIGLNKNMNAKYFKVFLKLKKMPIAKGSIYLKKILVHGVKCMGHYSKNRSGNCFANRKFSIFFLPLDKTASKFCASITEELQLVSITVVDDYIFQKYQIFWLILSSSCDTEVNFRSQFASFCMSVHFISSHLCLPTVFFRFIIPQQLLYIWESHTIHYSETVSSLVHVLTHTAENPARSTT